MSAPIRAFVGPNGGGKTLAAMALCVAPALSAGRRVVSTCRIDHPNASVLSSWRDIARLDHCVFLLDEISSQFPSRNAMSLPPQLVRVMNQLRKIDVECVWTAPNWARADAVLREVTQEVTVCRGFSPDRYHRERGVVPGHLSLNAPAVRLPGGGKSLVEARWRPNRLFRWRSYSAVDFDEFTYHAVKDVRPLKTTWYWRPFHRDQWLYDTLEGVATLDHLDETGVCLTCGGHRSRAKCTCPPLSASEPGGAGWLDDEDGVPLPAGVVPDREDLGPIARGRRAHARVSR